MKTATLAAGLLISAIACFSFSGCKSKPEATFDNPVIKRNCPDPTILDNRSRDGFFYVYSTRLRVDDKVYQIPIYRSTDLVSWEFVGAAFTEESKPSWEPKGALWAPDINYIDGRYVLYYAMGVWGNHDASASGVAVSDSPTGPFKDLGMIVSMENTGVGNSIDPNFFEDNDGRTYLYWGSLSHATDQEMGRKSGIHVAELTDDGLSLKPGTEIVKIAGDRMEGTYVCRRGKYYYLFASEGSCCEGAKSTYHVIVGRSESPWGPFVSQSGMSMITGDEGIYDGVILVRDPEETYCGPGHDAEIVTDDHGADWMPYI